jgi:hypothetical protein
MRWPLADSPAGPGGSILLSTDSGLAFLVATTTTGMDELLASIGVTCATLLRC